MKTYAEKLKDPLWQRKRLEILERDKFTCRGCHSTQKTLHVHHSHYKKGANPWEYSSDDLVTFCEDCHSEIESNRERILRYTCNNLHSSRTMLALATLENLENCHYLGETKMDARWLAASASISSLADFVRMSEESDPNAIEALGQSIDSLYRCKFNLEGEE